MDNPTDSRELIQDLNRSYGLELKEELSFEQLTGLIAERLNEWIRSDMNALLLFLYRVDISESRLRLLLHEAEGEDAGMIMAKLVLERQWQKIQTRRLYKTDNTIPDEDKW